jgi:hypothetical protein
MRRYCRPEWGWGAKEMGVCLPALPQPTFTCSPCVGFCTRSVWTPLHPILALWAPVGHVSDANFTPFLSPPCYAPVCFLLRTKLQENKSTSVQCRRAAVKKYHKLRVYSNRNLFSHKFWRSEVQNAVVCRAGSIWRFWGRTWHMPLLASGILGLWMHHSKFFLFIIFSFFLSFLTVKNFI